MSMSEQLNPRLHNLLRHTYRNVKQDTIQTTHHLFQRTDKQNIAYPD